MNQQTLEINKPLVQEVLDFAQSGRTLNVHPVILPFECIVLSDFSQAKSLSLGHELWEEIGDETDDEITEDDLDEEGLSLWPDIREEEESKIVKAKFELPDYRVVTTLEKEWRIREIIRSIVGTLPAKYSDETHSVTEDVIVDLAACARARLIMGTSHDFFEDVFKIYKAGLWPCGWEGNYPDGQLVVFQPKP